MEFIGRKLHNFAQLNVHFSKTSRPSEDYFDADKVPGYMRSLH